MKKVFYYILSIGVALLFTLQGFPISAQTPTSPCRENGECKRSVFDKCCSGSTQDVPVGTCLSRLQCAATISGASKICDLLQGESRVACDVCMNGKSAVWTAIGCIDTSSANGLLESFLPLGIGIAGGISFLLILFGALQMMMSAGNPEKLNAGKEIVSAAIMGLLLIIFSVFLLRLIGVNLLKIPKFM